MHQCLILPLFFFLPRLWGFMYSIEGGTGVKVAVLDTLINAHHNCSVELFYMLSLMFIPNLFIFYAIFNLSVAVSRALIRFKCCCHSQQVLQLFNSV